MSNPPKHLYEFGDFRFDPERPRLTRKGEVVSLTPKALEVLLVLVQSGGAPIEKEELMQKVWPDTFVEEGNLSVHIFALRKALGENGEGRRYIETVPKQGYRFTSSVRKVNPNDSALIVERHAQSIVTIEEQRESFQDKEFPASLAKSQAIFKDAPGRHRYAQVVVVASLLLAVTCAFIYFRGNSRSTVPVQLRSIAVLPFKPLSPGAGDEYFRTGMADALIIKLGSLRQIVVRPTSSVLAYTDSTEDSQTIGRRLAVDAVLEGFIQRDGERIRATVRLVNVRDGSQLWAGRFDDSFTSVFAVQDSISAQVAHSLSPTLIKDEEQRALAKHYTNNTEAYLEYLKGRYFWGKRTEESLRRSIESFQKAIELDPNYALAYAGLADSYALLVWNVGPVDPDLINKARLAARKALELDSSLAEAHASLAFTRCWYEWDFEGAETEYEKAIALNPNYATAHHWYGEFLVLMGRFDEGFRQLKRAQEIDPLSLVINADIGKMHFFARRPDQAIDQLKKTIELNPDFPISHLFIAMAYRQKGMYDEAFKELEEEGKVSEGRTIFPAVLAYCYAVAGKRTEARRLLEELAHSATEFEIALIHVGLGDNDQAFAWLEKAYYKRDPFLLYLKVDPNLDSLRADSRFQSLLTRLNLD